MSEKKQDNLEIMPAKSTIRGTFEAVAEKRIPLQFFRTKAGNEPVGTWLKALPTEDRRLIGHDLQVVEFGWPVGMPICRPMGDRLHEVRTQLPGNRISRVFFYVDRNQRLVALHAIVKKGRATPVSDLKLARQNMRKHEEDLE